MNDMQDGYHLGLLVTILLLAAGVVVSFVTLRPRAALPVTAPSTAPVTALSTALSTAPITAPITGDELAGELIAADDMAP